MDRVRDSGNHILGNKDPGRRFTIEIGLGETTSAARRNKDDLGG